MMNNKWRAMPSDEIRRAWETKGGRWLVVIQAPLKPGVPYQTCAVGLLVGEDRRGDDILWLPVWPGTPEKPDWSYDARGWGIAIPTDEADYPEPPPVNVGREVTPALLNWLQNLPLRMNDDWGVDTARDLIKSRAAFGLQKYGQPLRTEDGRNVIHDARQELGDLLQYVMSAHMQSLDLGPIRRLLPILEALLANDSVWIGEE